MQQLRVALVLQSGVALIATGLTVSLCCMQMHCFYLLLNAYIFSVHIALCGAQSVDYVVVQHGETVMMVHPQP
jgi:hypothetical protein